MVVLLLTVLVLYVTMVYAPIAAMLVEMFPTRIRYTSMSLPYHIGNGWFGGFLPDDVVRDRGGDRKHLLGALVSDRHRGGDLRHRDALRAGDEGRGHLPARLIPAEPCEGAGGAIRLRRFVFADVAGIAGFV